LRGFTKLSETLPRDALITLLNEYFGAMTQAVEDAGGEILKFVGDAMLAIFPLDAGAETACGRALPAATQARAATTRINAKRNGAGQPAINFGIALHLGDVMYGNIGGESRLDFTVIGPAVNLVARIQGLCGELRRPLLVSDALRGHAGRRSRQSAHSRLRASVRRNPSSRHATANEQCLRGGPRKVASHESDDRPVARDWPCRGGIRVGLVRPEALQINHS